ncbi:MAG: metallophosphoesterase [Paenibacillaceae bacterium]|nr:metallophosphoesterase [Paenibacillaceae bacterium]
MLLHTNDIHSSFQVMPRIAGTVARLRASHPSVPVIVADCGDHMDRMSTITEAGAGDAHLEVLEKTGYDVVTLGNNEGLTFTKARLQELFGGGTPVCVIAANLRDQETTQAPEWMKSSLIWERDGLRIGITGATAQYPIFYQLLGWQVDEPVEALKKEVHTLRQAGVHAVVVLSHLGLRTDKRLAEEVEGIDVILGGHTHHVLEEPLLHERTYLCAAGSMGRYVGEVELSFDPDSGQLVQVQGRLHETVRGEEDPAVRKLVEERALEAAAVMQERITVLGEGLEVDWERDSPLGNLLAAGIRKQTGAELALINSGQLLTSLLPGPVTRGTLLELCPSPVNTCITTLTGQELRQALEESLLAEFVELPLYGNGFRGKRLGGLCVDGLEVYWDARQEPYSRITALLYKGEPLRPDREYRVATGDMFTFGTGYLSLKGRDPQYFLPDFLRHVLEKELNDPEALRLCRISRFHLFP